MTHRPPPHGAAGTAGGALTGSYPSPAQGSPSTAGYAYRDDFIRPPETIGGIQYAGDRLWKINDIGSASTAVAVVPSAVTEVGVCELQTAATPGLYEGGTICHGYAAMSGSPVEGSMYLVKVCASTTYTLNVVLWSGFASSAVISPRTANVVDFIGLRAENTATVANWHLVCHRGPNEATLDLGVAADDTFRIIGFRRLLDGSVEGVTVDAANGWRGAIITSVGTIDTYIPTGNLMPIPLGIAAGIASKQKCAQIDYLDLGGNAERSS